MASCQSFLSILSFRKYWMVFANQSELMMLAAVETSKRVKKCLRRETETATDRQTQTETSGTESVISLDLLHIDGSKEVLEDKMMKDSKCASNYSGDMKMKAVCMKILRSLNFYLGIKGRGWR